MSILKVWDGSAWVDATAGGGGGVTDHGALTGLADDDHPQYGSRSTLDALRNHIVNGRTAAPQLMAAPPNIALSAAEAATGIASSAVVTPNDAAFTYLGAAMTNVGTLGAYSNCYRQTAATLTNTGQVGQFLNVEFETDADDFEVILRSGHSTLSRYRVWVNEEPAHAHAAVGSSGFYYRVRVTFPSTGARRIRIEGQGVSFCGLQKLATRTIWKTVRDTGPVCVAVTDSYGSNWDGATDASLWVWDNFVCRAGRYLGWNVYPSPVGGTGFTSTNGGSNLKFGSRLASDVFNLEPDIVVVAGSYNDNGQTLATVQTDVNAWFAAARSALPNATIIGVGGITPLDSATNMGTIEGYISTACSVYSCTFVPSTAWINGTGYTGATTGVGNSDLFTAADGVHLTTAGYTYCAERLAGALGGDVGRRSAPTRSAFTSTQPGLVPASGGGTSNFLRADGTFAAPSAGGSLTVQDENGNVATGVTQIDFQGAGVAATAGSGEVVVTIGGGSSTDTVTVTFSIFGALATGTDVFRWYNKSGSTLTVNKVWASVGTSPTGASILVDVNKNGTTLFTTQGNRPTISASGFVSTTTAPDVTTVADGDYLTFDIDQVGSTAAGSNLIVTLLLRY